MKTSCKICGQSDVEHLLNYNTTRYLRHPYKFNFKTKLYICNYCGFVFSKGINKKQINEFYKKNVFYDYKIYKHYDINKRINTYSKCFNLKKINMLEIGGGDNKLLRIFFKKKNSNYYNSDLNKKYINDQLIKNKKYDVIVDHMVIEHLIDIHKHFKMVSEKLTINGFYLSEIPDINKYKNSLLLFNALHINHYNEFCLRKIALKYDLSLIKIIKKNYSHSQGISFLFQKNTKRKLINKKNNIGEIKKIFHSSVEFLKKDKLKIKNELKKNKKMTVLWGASEFLNLYFDRSKKNCMVVDVNKEKIGTYGELKVYNPLDIAKYKSKIKLIIIMTPNPVANKNIKSYIKKNINLNLKNIKIMQIGNI